MMTGPDLVHKYFLDLSTEQRTRFELLGPLYREWNERVNLISRKDIEHLYERHVLHSLGIAKVHQLKPGERIIDVGTGGGFPGIPLAILYPRSRFHLIDGIGKKIIAVQGLIEALELTNATSEQARSEEHKGLYDVIVSRAVAPLPEFIKATRHLLAKGQGRMLYLKGGDLSEELKPVRNEIRVHDLADHFREEFFDTKKAVEVSF